MFKFSKFIASAFVAAAVVTAPAAQAISGDRAGNGGHFMEMKVITKAYEVLDVLKELERQGALPVRIDLERFANVLKSVRVAEKKQVTLNGLDRSAANYPKENLLEITTQDFAENKDNPEDFFEMTLHEFLPLVGVPDPSHVHSLPIRKTASAMGLTRKRTDRKVTPVLLFQQGMDDGENMDFSTAQRECARQKALHARAYYYVYCVYYEDEIRTTILEPVADEYFSVLRDYYYDVELTRSRTYWHSVERTLRDYRYGLRVFGLGVPAELPWKLVASSLGLGDGLIDRTFASEPIALEACRARLMDEARSGSPVFYRARCRTPRLTDGVTYYYEIVTQNPLVDPSVQ